MQIYLNTTLNIAQNTQYRTFAVHLTSFSSDSRQEIVWLYLLSRNMKEVYQHLYLHGSCCDGLTDGVAFVVKRNMTKN